MRLLQLLASVDEETIDRIASIHLGVGEYETRAAACANLETVVRSPKHIRDAVFTLRPPTFCALSAALEADEHRLPLSGLKQRVGEAAMAIAEAVTARQILPRDELKLYRRVLMEARRNDLELDPSETALLAVLRQELQIRQVEHFLIEHHGDLQPYWNTEHAFLDALNGLRSSGIAFVVDGTLALPDELVPILRQVLGIEAGRDACRRLCERVSGAALTDTLATLELRTSGTKEEKIARLLENFVQPSDVLRHVGIGDLKDLCRDLGLLVTGAKDELVMRVVQQFASSADLRPPSAPPPPPPAEPRVLTPETFDSLFSCLRGQDLGDILTGIGSQRVTGAKEHLVKLVRESRFSELSLLLELDGRQLEAALGRMHLNKNGTKAEKARRLIDFFAEGGMASAPASTAFSEISTGLPLPDDVH